MKKEEVKMKERKGKGKWAPVIKGAIKHTYCNASTCTCTVQIRCKVRIRQTRVNVFVSLYKPI